MSSFTAPLILTALPTTNAGRGEFRVHKPFVYHVGFLGSGDIIEVQRGFKTDLASIPWFARPFIPLAGKLAKPALLHDWLLSKNDPRASDVFEEACIVAEVSPFLRRIVVGAVRLYAKFR